MAALLFSCLVPFSFLFPGARDRAALERDAALRAALEEMGGLAASEGRALGELDARMSEKLDALGTALAKQSRAVRAETAARMRSAEERVSASLDGVRESVEALSGRVAALDRALSAPGSASAGVSAGFDPSVIGDLDASRLAAAGREAFEAGRHDAAAGLFEEAARIRPADGAARLLGTVSRFYANPSDSSAYARCDAECRAALGEDPGNTTALEALARLALERGAWVEAVEWFERLVRAGGADEAARVAAANAAAWAGDAGKAAWFRRGAAPEAAGLSVAPEGPEPEEPSGTGTLP